MYSATEANRPKYITHQWIMSTYLLGLFLMHFDFVVLIQETVVFLLDVTGAVYCQVILVKRFV